MRKLELLHKDSVLDVPSMASRGSSESVPQNNEAGESDHVVGLNIEDGKTYSNASSTSLANPPGQEAPDKQISSKWRSLFGVKTSSDENYSVGDQRGVEPSTTQVGNSSFNPLEGKSVDCGVMQGPENVLNEDAPSVLSEDDFSRDSGGSVKVMKYDMPSDSYGSTKQKSLLYKEAERLTKKNPLQNFVDNLPWNKHKQDGEEDKIPTIAEDSPSQDEGNLWQDLLVPELAEERNAKKPIRRRDFKRTTRTSVSSDNNSVGSWNSNNSGMSWVSQSMKGRGILKGVPSQIGISQVGVFGDDSSLYSQSSFGSQMSGASRRSLFPRVQYQVTSSKTKKKTISFASKARVVVFQYKIRDSGEVREWNDADIWWQRDDYREFRKVGELILTAVCEGESDVLSSHHKELHSEEDKKKWWHLLGHSSRGLEHVADVEEGDRRIQLVKDSMKVIFDEQRRQRKASNKKRFSVYNPQSSTTPPTDNVKHEKYDTEAFRERYLSMTGPARELAHNRALEDQEQASTNDALHTWEYKRYVEFRKQRRSLRRQQRQIYEASVLVLCRSVRRFLRKVRRRKEIRRQHLAATTIQSQYRRVLSNRILEVEHVLSKNKELGCSSEESTLNDPVLQNLSQNLISRRISSDALNLMPLTEVDSEDEDSTTAEDLYLGMAQNGSESEASNTQDMAEGVSDDQDQTACKTANETEASSSWVINKESASRKVLKKDAPATSGGVSSVESPGIPETSGKESESDFPSELPSEISPSDPETGKISEDLSMTSIKSRSLTGIETETSTENLNTDIVKSKPIEQGEAHAEIENANNSALPSSVVTSVGILVDNEKQKKNEADEKGQVEVAEIELSASYDDAGEHSKDAHESKPVDAVDMQTEIERFDCLESSELDRDQAGNASKDGIASSSSYTNENRVERLETPDKSQSEGAVRQEMEASGKDQTPLPSETEMPAKQAQSVASLISEVVIRDEGSIVHERSVSQISIVDETEDEATLKNKQLSRWFTFPLFTAGAVFIGAYYLKSDFIAGGHLSFRMPGSTRIFPASGAPASFDFYSMLHDSSDRPVSTQEILKAPEIDDLESIESLSSEIKVSSDVKYGRGNADEQKCDSVADEETCDVVHAEEQSETTYNSNASFTAETDGTSLALGAYKEIVATEDSPTTKNMEKHGASESGKHEEIKSDTYTRERHMNDPVNLAILGVDASDVFFLFGKKQ